MELLNSKEQTDPLPQRQQTDDQNNQQFLDLQENKKKSCAPCGTDTALKLNKAINLTKDKIKEIEKRLSDSNETLVSMKNQRQSEEKRYQLLYLLQLKQNETKADHDLKTKEIELLRVGQAESLLSQLIQKAGDAEIRSKNIEKSLKTYKKRHQNEQGNLLNLTQKLKSNLTRYEEEIAECAKAMKTYEPDLIPANLQCTNQEVLRAAISLEKSVAFSQSKLDGLNKELRFSRKDQEKAYELLRSAVETNFQEWREGESGNVSNHPKVKSFTSQESSLEEEIASLEREIGNTNNKILEAEKTFSCLQQRETESCLETTQSSNLTLMVTKTIQEQEKFLNDLKTQRKNFRESLGQKIKNLYRLRLQIQAEKTLLNLADEKVAIRNEVQRERENFRSTRMRIAKNHFNKNILMDFNELEGQALQGKSRKTLEQRKQYVKENLSKIDSHECPMSLSYPGGIQNLSVLEMNPYLEFSELWCEEMDLQAFRETLRSTVVNVFQTTYPGVPDRVRLKQELLNIEGYLRALVYQWLRNLWINVEKEQILHRDQVLSEKEILNKEERFKVLLNHFLDRIRGLTLPSREHLVANLGCTLVTTDPSESNHTCPELRKRNIYHWINTVTSNQKLMDELSVLLIDELYKSYWEALGRLSRIERHPVPFKSIQDNNFEEFNHWAKPHVQHGIQIIDMLPASRDDLVSMSINEGGVVANIAARAEGAVAYDINKLRMGAEVIDNVRGNWLKNRETFSANSEEPLEGFDATLEERQQISDAEELIDRSSLKQATESFGYGAGGRAKGSIYARAKGALAYSKRREYLDAAITASGRGDNFAKWVVRRSDLRSELAPLGSGTLVAAAHSGFPNGDQPFHLLVKIPDKSLQRDWDGKKYVLFNSSYTATKRFSAFKELGWTGLLIKGGFSIVNPAMWEDLEENIVGTVYPFKWDVLKRDDEGQRELLRKPNTLGGRIYLDETDKVKYSEVRTLIEAESAFIKTTRSAQSGNLNNLLNTLQEEEAKFRDEVDTHLKTLREEERKRLEEGRKRNQTKERSQAIKNQQEEPAPENDGV